MVLSTNDAKTAGSIKISSAGNIDDESNITYGYLSCSDSKKFLKSLFVIFLIISESFSDESYLGAHIVSTKSMDVF